MNNDWSPNEKKIKMALDELYKTDERKPSKPLDTSFMQASIKRNWFIGLRIAAVVVLVLITSFTTAIFISNDYASAIQDSVEQQIFEWKYGIEVTTDEEDMEAGVTVWEIDDFETALKAQKLVPKLLMPAYIPQKYMFDSLTLERYDDGDFDSTYTYSSQDSTLYFNCMSMDKEDSAFTNDVTDVIEKEDRKIVLWEDPIGERKGFTVFMEDSMAQLAVEENELDQESLLRIASEMTF